LSTKAELQPYITNIVQELRAKEISVKVDDSSGSIGRRYVNMIRITMFLTCTGKTA